MTHLNVIWANLKRSDAAIHDRREYDAEDLVQRYGLNEEDADELYHRIQHHFVMKIVRGKL